MSHPPHPQAYPSMGEVIDGKYQIERMLGEGGMGAVAKATHLLRRAPVALKFMSPNVVAFPGAVERFLNEGVAASQIDSDHVVHVYDVGKLPNGAPYLVMEYMEGSDIAELLAREGRPGIDITRAIHFTVQALRGLQIAHDAGIIHRDMKPSNCFVVHKDGEDDFVKLLDFGISKVQQGKSASLTQTNSALGTPLYMSPEQARSPRDVDLRSDLYSVAVILYELLTGKTPFNSESGEFTEILFKLFTADPPPIQSLRPDCPPGLAAVVHKGLARDPNERFANAGAFGVALEPWADARSARVISRLKAHQPVRPSQLPSPFHADPAKQFSKLQTGSMAQGPARDTERPPPGAPTEQSPQRAAIAQTPQPNQSSGAYPQSAAQTPQPNTTPARHSAMPESLDNRASSAAEAVAATQFNVTPSAGLHRGPEHAPVQVVSQFPPPLANPPGSPYVAPHPQAVRTDLGASRDASPPAHARKAKGPSPFVFALPALLVLGLVGGGVWKITHSGSGADPAASGSAAATGAPPTSSGDTNANLPPNGLVVADPSRAIAPDAAASTSTVASAAPSASAAPDGVPSVPVPSATAHATVSSTATAKPKPKPDASQNPPASGGHHVRLNDVTIVQ